MAIDPRRTADVEYDRDDVAALRSVYDHVTQGDRARALTADDLKRVRHLIRELDRAYTRSYGAAIGIPSVALELR